MNLFLSQAKLRELLRELSKKVCMLEIFESFSIDNIFILPFHLNKNCLAPKLYNQSCFPLYTVLPVSLYTVLVHFLQLLRFISILVASTIVPTLGSVKGFKFYDWITIFLIKFYLSFYFSLLIAQMDFQLIFSWKLVRMCNS